MDQKTEDAVMIGVATVVLLRRRSAGRIWGKSSEFLSFGRR